MNFAVEADDYRCIIYGVSKSDAINLLENLLYGCGFIKNHGKKKKKKKKKKNKTKNISINEKNYKDLVNILLDMIVENQYC